MMLEELKVGDRVRVVLDELNSPNVSENFNEIGTIVAIDNTIATPIAIRFDNNVNGHNLYPSVDCKMGYGWFVNPNDVVEKLDGIPIEEDWRTQRYNFYEKKGWL